VEDVVRSLTIFALLLALTCAAVAQGPPAGYKRNCMSCHGVDGKAGTPAGQKMKVPPFSSDAVQALTDDQLFDTIANGTTHKQYPHAFGRKGVSGPEIREIIRFIRACKPATPGKP
jgi:mono/diheme cytochrome c family protein